MATTCNLVFPILQVTVLMSCCYAHNFVFLSCYFNTSPANQTPPCQPMESLLNNNSSTSTTEPLLPLLNPDPTNCSAWDQQWGAPYLHRLAHLDMQLYQDFYFVWVTLMVRPDTV